MALMSSMENFEASSALRSRGIRASPPEDRLRIEEAALRSPSAATASSAPSSSAKSPAPLPLPTPLPPRPPLLADADADADTLC